MQTCDIYALREEADLILPRGLLLVRARWAFPHWGVTAFQLVRRTLQVDPTAR